MNFIFVVLIVWSFISNGCRSRILHREVRQPMRMGEGCTNIRFCNNFAKQDCIPVGCVLSAAVAVVVSAPGGGGWCLSLGGGLLPWGVGVGIPSYTESDPPPVNRMTERQV